MCQNLSVKFPCVYLCLSYEDLFPFLVRVSPFNPYFLSILQYFPLHTVSLYIILLQNCDLSGSDLHEANLRGANLKDAGFELMLTPLHMSQTIR